MSALSGVGPGGRLDPTSPLPDAAPALAAAGAEGTATEGVVSRQPTSAAWAVRQPAAPASAYPLNRQGASGAAVRSLQVSLNAFRTRLGLAPLAVDGSFGPGTAAAVAQFQKLWASSRTASSARGRGSGSSGSRARRRRSRRAGRPRPRSCSTARRSSPPPRGGASRLRSSPA